MHNFQGIHSRERTSMGRQQGLDKAEIKTSYVMTQTKLRKKELKWRKGKRIHEKRRALSKLIFFARNRMNQSCAASLFFTKINEKDASFRQSSKCHLMFWHDEPIMCVFLFFAKNNEKTGSSLKKCLNCLKNEAKK